MRCAAISGLHLVALATVLAFLSVMAKAQTADEQQQVAEVSGQMLVSTEWVAEHLNDSDVVILCVASDFAFYTRGHIPGARLLLRDEIAVVRDGIPNQLPSTEQLKKVFEAAGVTDLTRIILYGDRAGLLAARAYWTLDYIGAADHAALLDGGLERWQAEGRPLSQEMPQAVAGKLTVQPNPSVVVSATELQAMLQKNPNSITLIDARPANEFRGAQLSEGATRAGHLPGAKSLYWIRNLESAENPILRPESELRAMYAGLGASPDRLVITYCRTGMQSSFDYFVAKYLGYNAGMYAGSFLDWSNRGLPVEGPQAPAHR